MTTTEPKPPDTEAGLNEGGNVSKNDSMFGRRASWIFAGLLLALLAFAVYRVLDDGQSESWAHTRNAEPTPPAPPPAPELSEVSGHFEKNQTITEALLQQGLSHQLINDIVDCARPVYDLAKVHEQKPYYIYFAQDGTFRDFRYPVNNESYLTVYHDLTRDQLVPVMKDYKFEIRTANISAVINNSLYVSIMNIGEQYHQLTNDLADIFGYDIDFNTDIQKGDSFRALIEKKYLDGQFVKNGAVLAASISNKGTVFTGFRFEDENGKPAYYAPNGRALKRSFLKSPLKVYRITSRFSYARRHPILKIVRPHLGVDYAAPIGTPVQAVSSGVVVSAGRKGANGNMVHLRHTGGYETKYLHLSQIKVKVGDRVGQGDIIGNVGSTGLSTGPHLDFRISRHGDPKNPTKLIFPPAKPVAPDKLEHFEALRDRLMDEIWIPNPASQLAQK